MNVYGQILSDIVEPAKIWIAENGLDFAGRIVAASVILLIGAIAIKFLRKFVDKHTGDKVLLERFFVSVGTKIAWTVLLTVVISKLGVNVGPIIAGLGATGFIVGFAFQESLGSLAAGIMIAFNQPFKIGDYVTVAGYEGTVRHLDMMTVTRTTAGSPSLINRRGVRRSSTIRRCRSGVSRSRSGSPIPRISARPARSRSRC